MRRRSGLLLLLLIRLLTGGKERRKCRLGVGGWLVVPLGYGISSRMETNCSLDCTFSCDKMLGIRYTQ